MSYFGMNLKGIINIDRVEQYYWKVCGIIAFGIVLMVYASASRYRIRQRWWEYRVNQELFTA
jgi:hypothetical protein